MASSYRKREKKKKSQIIPADPFHFPLLHSIFFVLFSYSSLLFIFFHGQWPFVRLELGLLPRSSEPRGSVPVSKQTDWKKGSRLWPPMNISWYAVKTKGVRSILHAKKIEYSLLHCAQPSISCYFSELLQTGPIKCPSSFEVEN